jgi:gliding motility-associated-like protein
VQTLPALCSGSNGSANTTFSGGTGPYSADWFSGATNIQSQSNLNSADTLFNLAAGAYSVVVTDANGCSSQLSFSVSNTGGPAFSALNVSPVLCFGDSTGTGFSSVSGGTAPFTFLWTDASNNTILNQPGSTGSSSVIGLAAGNYQISVTDASGCVSFQSFTVVQPSAPLGLSQVTINPATCGNANGSIVVTPTGGTPSYNFVWTPTGGTDSLVQNILAGIYVLALSDSNACAFDTTITLSNSDGPQVQPGLLVNPTCFGGNNGSASVQVSGGTPPYSYAWSGSAAGNTPSANNLSAGNYVVTVTDASGCTQNLPLSLSQPPSISYTSSSVGASCGNANGVATIIANGGIAPYTYVWSTGATGTTTISQIPTGLYSALITDSAGCTVLATVNVGGSAGPVIDAGEDVVIQAGQSVNLDASSSGVLNYLWSPSEGLSCTACPDPVASPDTTTLYIVSVNYNGCIGSDTVLISVEKNCGDIFIPSAFSPNSDGNNDKLYLRGICIQSMLFKVYDRWGKLLFETKDPALGWDGTFEGEPCLAGVYTYTAEVTVKGAVLSSKGNVTLHR